MNQRLSLLFASIALGASAFAEEDYFKSEIRPLLANRCVVCHHEGRAEGGLRLDTREGFEKSGISAAAKEPDASEEEEKRLKWLRYPLRALPKGHPTVPPAAVGLRFTALLDVKFSEWVNKHGARWTDETPIRPESTEEQALSDSLSLNEIRNIHARATSRTAEPAEAYAEAIPGLREKSTSFRMLPIPAGKFMMGSPENEPGRRPDEGPQHEVALDAFWMQETEMFWDVFDNFLWVEQYRKTRGIMPIEPRLIAQSDALGNPSQPYVELSFGMGNEGFPVVAISHHNALRFCQWLSVLTGRFYRLPTEAEWEYAARAGTTTAFYWGDDPTQIKDYCWYGLNSDFKYQKVGTKKPNAWGLHDMLGNVSEWVVDGYDPAFYSRSPRSNPWNELRNQYPHSIRGGSWDSETPSLVRCAVRDKSDKAMNRQDPQNPKNIYYLSDAQTVGFRIVRPAKVPTPEEMWRIWNNGSPPISTKRQEQPKR